MNSEHNGSCNNIMFLFSGSVYSWGMGTNKQLGTGEEDDEWSPVPMSGKQLLTRYEELVQAESEADICNIYHFQSFYWSPSDRVLNSAFRLCVTTHNVFHLHCRPMRNCLHSSNLFSVWTCLQWNKNTDSPETKSRNILWSKWFLSLEWWLYIEKIGRLSEWFWFKCDQWTLLIFSGLLRWYLQEDNTQFCWQKTNDRRLIKLNQL